MKSAEEILCRFKIVPTEQRVALLKLILNLEKSPFSGQDLTYRIIELKVPVSHNTLATTLQLFVTRKVLCAFPTPNDEKKKGRPAMLYVVNVPAIYPISNASTTKSQDESENVKGIDFN